MLDMVVLVGKTVVALRWQGKSDWSVVKMRRNTHNSEHRPSPMWSGTRVVGQPETGLHRFVVRQKEPTERTHPQGRRNCSGRRQPAKPSLRVETDASAPERAEPRPVCRLLEVYSSEILYLPHIFGGADFQYG